ncbi:MAG: DUF4043 family protein [bacterium]|nr:DUF4043 family protein [bacterium]
MSATPIFDQLQVQAWRKKMVKEVVNNTVWISGLSNRLEVSSNVPNAGQKTIPDSVVHYVSDSFKKGVQKTTIPFMSKLKDLGQGGWQKVEGNEETPTMRFRQINYNLQRKGLTVTDESVEGDLTEYYNIASQKVQLLTDYFKELMDYNFQRALLCEADEFLTESEYWQGETLTSAPVAKTHHPSVLVNGASAPVTYNSNQTTYGGAIKTAADGITGALNPFDLAALDSCIFQADSGANNKLQKLSWKSGNRSINYVLKLSETQAQQLTTTTGSGTWRELMQDAGARGVDNRAISGILGNYKRTLIIVDERAPLFDTSVAATADPAAQYQFYKIEDGRTPAEHTGAGVGTCEVAAMLSKAAIGAAKVKDLNFTNKTFDYSFVEGMAASQAGGCERMDLKTSVSTARPLNQSSFLYLTGTPGSTL